MCQFFSLISDGKGKAYYFNAEQRKQIQAGTLKGLSGNVYYPDSHSSIASHYRMSNYNAYEYNPFTKVFRTDRHSSALRCDSQKLRRFCKKLDFNTIIPDFRRSVKLPQRVKQTRKIASKKDLLLLKEFVLHRFAFSVPLAVSMLMRRIRSLFGSGLFCQAVIKSVIYPKKRQAKAVGAARELYERGLVVCEGYVGEEMVWGWCLQNKNQKSIKEITAGDLRKIA